MPKRKAPPIPSRPKSSERLSALGIPSSEIPQPFREDADFIAPSFREGVDQDDSPQPFSEFSQDPNRNVATQARRVLVVVPVGLSLAGRALAPHSIAGVPVPTVAAIAEWLSAFTGLPTRVIPELPVVPWPSDPRSKGKKSAGAVAVRTSRSLVRVRSRPSSDGEFLEALEVLDVLDALLEELPDDAFAIVGVTPFDIAEGGCPVGGRAFGGSRIACVSLARYHPAFDDVVADWPSGVKKGAGGAITARARAATASLPPPSGGDLWLERVCTQVAHHEVGHCLGLDHCLYYGCFMGENEGQPPYACPVCLRKIFDTTGAARGSAATSSGVAAARTHYQAIVGFCESDSRLQVQKWAALRAWAFARLEQLK